MSEGMVTLTADGWVERGQDCHEDGYHDRRNIIEHGKNRILSAITPQQCHTVNQYEQFGWVFFVRNLKTDDPVVFIVSPDRNSVMLVDTEGECVEEHNIVYRH